MDEAEPAPAPFAAAEAAAVVAAMPVRHRPADAEAIIARGRAALDRLAVPLDAAHRKTFLERPDVAAAARALGWRG